MAQFVIQAKAVGLVFVWTAVVAFISFQVVKFTVGLRVSEEEEREGLDITAHGERAYTA
jgi:Amt family ammonium transporter